MSRPAPIDMGINISRQSNSYGAFKIIQYHTSKDITVEFLDTGYRTSTNTNNIRRGAVKDPLRPYVQGFGIVGVGEFSHKKTPLVYTLWFTMLRNVAKGTHTMDSAWHNLQDFGAFLVTNFPEHTYDYVFFTPNGKHYAPTTVASMPFTEHRAFIHGVNEHPKKLVSPDGVVHTLTNVSAFCREHKLGHASNAFKVLNGSERSVRGWTLYVPE